MKNKDLHKTLDALSVSAAPTPRHQQKLKAALLRYEAPQQTLFQKLQAAAKNILGVPMAHKKLFTGLGTLALIAILAVSFTTFNLSHSPQAEAEQLVNQGIERVRTFGTDKMSQIQSQLGGDPTAALDEAKAAKDLKVITKDEFDGEYQKHKGVAMSSLGKDGPQFGAVGISVNGHLPPEPSGEGAVRHSTNGPVSGETRSIEDGQTTSQEPERDYVVWQQSQSQAPADPQQAPPPPVELPTPSKYLRYTNSTGHVVVLGLDDQGVPVTKTIFMNDSDVQNADGSSFRVGR